MCAVDEVEFDSGLLDSLVVPFAETELHGPLTQLMTCNMTPPPREALAGVELAHIFDTGWAIGKICGKIKRHLACLVPRQWLHKLDIEMYGEDKFWVIVERTSGSPPPHQPPLVHALGIEQLHARAKTLQKQIDHAEAQQRERQKERENARDGDRGRGGSSSSGEAEEEAEAAEEEAQSADTSADEMARQRNRKRLRRHEHR